MNTIILITIILLYTLYCYIEYIYSGSLLLRAYRVKIKQFWTCNRLPHCVHLAVPCKEMEIFFFLILTLYFVVKNPWLYGSAGVFGSRQAEEEISSADDVTGLPDRSGKICL